MRTKLLPELFATTTLLLTPFISSVAKAVGRDKTSGTTTDEWDRGTFHDPTVNVRPKFRYWAPDASIDDTRIDMDIEQLQSTH